MRAFLLLLLFAPACALSHLAPTDAGAAPADAFLVDASAPGRDAGLDAPATPAWAWSNPRPTGVDLHGVWGFSARDVWAVGDLGTVIHFDGVDWTVRETGTTTALNGIWGSAPDDLWVVGGSGLFGREVSGLIMHWDGRAWSRLETGTSGLFGVAGTGPEDVWAVGYGTVLHYDGRTWTPSFTSEEHNLLGVWASAPDDVWAVGDYQPLLHYDGRSWSTVVSGAEPEGIGGHAGVFGLAPDDVWSCSWIRGIEHWDGLTWTDVGPSRGGVTNVWALGNEVWAVGARGRIDRWDGRAFASVPRPVEVDLEDMWGSAPNDAWVVGRAGTLLHWDGRELSSFSTITPNHELHDVWSSSPTDAWAVGFFRTDVGSSIEERGMILHWDGTDWSLSPSGTVGPSYRSHLQAVWGARPNAVWAAGGDGTILRWDGREWQAVESSTRDRIDGLWGSGEDDVWAAGYMGIQHWDGERWSTVDDTPYLQAVSGSGPDDVWVVGDYGTVLHWNGSTWAPFPLPEHGLGRLSLKGVWVGSSSDVWVAGGVIVGATAREGILLHFDGRAWTLTPAPALEDLWGASTTDVWAVGTLGVQHFDGTTWSASERVPSGVSALFGIWGRGPGEAWAVGSMGTILTLR